MHHKHTHTQDPVSEQTPQNSQPQGKKNRFKFSLWYLLIPLVLGAIALVVILIVGGSIATYTVFNNIQVDVDGVKTRFIDVKGKPIEPGVDTLLNPGATVDRLQKGFVEVKLTTEVQNRNPIAIKATDIDYKVHINGIKAGTGKLPAKGKPPIEIAGGGLRSLKLDVRVPIRKIFEKDVAAILKGGVLRIKVTGTATAEAFGIPMRHAFKVNRKHRYGPSTSDFPIPLP